MYYAVCIYTTFCSVVCGLFCVKSVCFVGIRKISLSLCRIDVCGSSMLMALILAWILFAKRRSMRLFSVHLDCYSTVTVASDSSVTND